MRSALVGAARSLSLSEYVVYLGFLAIFLFFSITLHDRGFLSPANMMTITVPRPLVFCPVDT
jgi:ribose transport system permease protein